LRRQGPEPRDCPRELRARRRPGGIRGRAGCALTPKATLEQGEARLAARKALGEDRGGVLHFWLRRLEERLAASKSGFAVGDALTIADLRIFCELTAATSGW
jgi:glutathione S-transferase